MFGLNHVIDDVEFFYCYIDGTCESEICGSAAASIAVTVIRT